MGVNTKKAREMAKSQKDTAKVKRAGTQRQNVTAEQRQKVMERFDPSVIDYVKENFSLDLATIPVGELYKLSRKEFAGPFETVLHPLAYDAEAKERVEMPAIKQNLYMRLLPPQEGGKPCAIDDKHNLIIQTLPVRPYIEITSEVSEAPVPERQDVNVKFTESQMRALEGVGIIRERLYGGFNHLSRAVKNDILNGEVFEVDGRVTTAAGYVNVAGKARLVTDDEGNATAVYESNYPEKRTEGKVVDIEQAGIIGTLELELFRMSPDGKKRITDATGAPIPTQAAWNLMEFGSAMEPVKGYVHKRERSSNGAWEDVREEGMYLVRAVGGSLFAQAMEKVETKEGVSWQVKNPNIKDGKVFVTGQMDGPLPFKSEADMKNFLEGRPAVIEGVTYKDSKGVVTYDAVVVPMENGSAQKFSPETSEKILKKVGRKKEQSAAPVRKRRFGVSV